MLRLLLRRRGAGERVDIRREHQAAQRQLVVPEIGHRHGFADNQRAARLEPGAIEERDVYVELPWRQRQRALEHSRIAAARRTHLGNVIVLERKHVGIALRRLSLLLCRLGGRLLLLELTLLKREYGQRLRRTGDGGARGRCGRAAYRQL